MWHSRCALALAAMVVSTLIASTALADTACWVYVAGDCHGSVPQGTWFDDGWSVAASDSATCLHRARDYAQWCGLINDGDQVNAAFISDGVTVNAQMFKPGTAS